MILEEQEYPQKNERTVLTILLQQIFPRNILGNNKLSVKWTLFSSILQLFLIVRIISTSNTRYKNLQHTRQTTALQCMSNQFTSDLVNRPSTAYNVAVIARISVGRTEKFVSHINLYETVLHGGNYWRLERFGTGDLE